MLLYEYILTFNIFTNLMAPSLMERIIQDFNLCEEHVRLILQIEEQKGPPLPPIYKCSALCILERDYINAVLPLVTPKNSEERGSETVC